MKLKFFIFSIGLFMISSCNVEPQPINYGEDSCDFCRMTIVEQQYGCELVTTKGKVYKFDALECLLNFKKQYPENNYSYQMTNTYTTPAELRDATSSTYLISPNLPSPMGANITPFSSKEEAEKVQKEKGGELYDFEQLTQQMNGGEKPHHHHHH